MKDIPAWAQKAVASSVSLSEAQKAAAASAAGLAAGETAAEGATLGLGTAIKGAAVSISSFVVSNAPILALIGGIAVALLRANSAAHAYENAMEEASNAQSDYDSTVSELESVNSELSTTKTRMEELQSKGTLTLTEQAELEQLQAQNAELEREAALLENVAAMQQRAATIAAIDALSVEGSQSQYVKDHAAEIDGAVGYTTELEAAKEDLKYLTELYNKRADLQEQMQSAAASGDQKLYNSLTDQLKDTDAEITSYTTSLGTQVAQFQEYRDTLAQDVALGEVSGGDQMLSALDEFLRAYANIGNELTPAQDALEKIQSFFNSSDSKNAITEQILDMVAAGDDATEAIAKIGLSLDDLGLEDSQASYLNQYFKDLADSATEAANAVDEIDSSLSGIATASESENAGDNFDDYISYIDNARRYYAQGKTGLDDFKTVAASLNNGSQDAADNLEQFSKNIDKISKYLTVDTDSKLTQSSSTSNVDGTIKSSITLDDGQLTVTKQNMLDLADAFEDARQSAEETGTEFKSTADLATALDIPVDFLEYALGKMQDYDISTAFDNLPKASQNLNDAKTALASLQEVYDNMTAGRDKDALGEKIENWQTQITAAEGDLDTLDTDLVLQITAELDLQQIQAQIDQAQSLITEGGASTQSYAELNAEKRQYRSTSEAAIGWDREGIEIPVTYKLADDAISELQEKLASETDEKKKMEIQAEISNLYDVQNQIMDAFRDAHPEITAETDIDEANATFENWINSEDGKEIIAKITADNEVGDIIGDELPDVLITKILAEDDATSVVASVISQMSGIPEETITEMLVNDNASEQVIALLAQMTGLPDSEIIDLIANDNITAILTYLLAHLDELPEEVQTILSADGDEAKSELDDVQEQANTLNDTTVVVELDAQADEANATLDGITAKMLGLDEETFLNIQAQDNASDAANAVLQAIDGIPLEVLTRMIAQDDASGVLQVLYDYIKQVDGATVETEVDADTSDAEESIERLTNEDLDVIRIQATIDDSATAEIAAFLSELTGIPTETLITMIASDEASPEILSVMSALAGIPEETLARISAEDGASSVILSVLSSLSGLDSTKIIQLLASDQASAIIGKVNAQKLNTKTTLLQARDAATSTVRKVQNLKIAAKKFTISVTDYATSTLNRVKSLLSSIKSKTVTVATNTVNTISTIYKTITGSTYNGTAHANGTGNNRARGTAHDSGDWSVQKNETALINELGKEIVVRDGKWFTINNGYPAFTELKKGDIVFNHKQTEDLLRKGYVTNSHAQVYGSYANGSAHATGTAFASGSSDSSTNTIDWIEIALDRLEAIAKKYSTRMESTFNNLTTRLKEWNNTTYDTKVELQKQQAAYKAYLEAAEKVNLSETLKKQVREGGTYIYDGYSDSEKEAFDEYKELYDKAMDASQAIEDLTVSLAELYKTAFDIVQERYDNEFTALENRAKLISNNIDLAEAQGYSANAKDYESLISFEQRKRAKGEQEYADLVEKMEAAVASGTISKFSDEWWDMYNATLEVASGIQEADIALAEFQQDLEDLKWDNFDYLEDRISQLTSEADFLIKLFDTDNLIDDNGNLTSEGWSVVSLHNQNYLTYMQQVEDYKDAIKELDAELASDSGNQNLIERREELLKAEQDAILAAMDEKDAIKDLISEAYDELADSIGDVVDQYEDALDAVKDLYTYQKNITKATKNIAALQKQLLAYEDDTSEENKARVQKIRLELEEAQADLADTEYDQYVSSAKKLLDNLQSELEQVLNERVDDVDALLEDVVNGIDSNSDAIASTIQDTAASAGYEMTSCTAEILNGTGTQLQNITSVLSEIKSYVASIQAQSSAVSLDSNGDPILDDSGNVSTGNEWTMAVEYGNTTTGTTTASTATTAATTSTSSDTSSNSTATNTSSSIFKYKKYTGNKSKLDKNNSIVDRLKYFDFDSSYSARKGYYSALGLSGTYTGSSSQNIAMLNKMKNMGYSSGGYVADLQKIALYNGDDLVTVNTLKKGEAVLTAEQAAQFREFISKIPIANAMLDTSKFIPDIPTQYSDNDLNGIVGKTEINVSIDHVQDYNDFVSQMQKDPRVEKIVQGMTVDQLAGKGSLAKYKVK